MESQSEKTLYRAASFSWERSMGSILVLALLLLCPALACKDRPVVNMSQVIVGGNDGGSSDTRPELRIAVAARISPESTRDLYDALLKQVANRVGRRAVFSQRRTYAEVNAMLEAREIDLAFVCAGPYVGGRDAFGMELLVVPLVRGEALYHAYILVGKNSTAQTFEDLRDRRFAFTDPDSNTGCLVPTHMLAERKETPGSFFSESFFTYSHDASIRAVADGQADGASVDSLVWDFFNTEDPVFTSRTRIIERSPPYGIPPVVVHPDLDPELKEGLRDAFLGIHEDLEVKEVIRRLQIDRFSPGEDSAYDTVRKMRRWAAQREEIVQ